MPSSVHLYNLTAPTLIDLAVIKKEVEKDDHPREIISRLKKEEEVYNYSLPHEMLRYKGRLVISKSSSTYRIAHVLRFYLWRPFWISTNI